MPITVDALILGLTAGAKSYDPEALEFATAAANSEVHDYLSVQVFASSLLAGQKLQNTPVSSAGTSFTTPVTTGAAGPGFKVKSYLNAPVVCPIHTSGTATKIAFAINHASAASGDLTEDGVGNYANGTGNTKVVSGAPVTESAKATKQGDIFMVITMSPGIAVTEGGYLTVKGYAAGVSGSDSFTYITLESGS